MAATSSHGELNGCCRVHVQAVEVMVVARGCCMVVGFGCLQRTVAADVAWQRLVRCGTVSEDGACGNGSVG